MRSIIFVLLLSALSLVHGACVANETQGSNPGEFTDPREFRISPSTPADLTKYYQDIITVFQYNIRSGFSRTCIPNLDSQAAFMASFNPHFFAFQEVNINVSTRCNCSQPQAFANATGAEVAFFRSYYFENTGLYGHGIGSIYPVQGVQSHLFTNYTSEMRGVIAQIIQPPQFGTRKLLLVGNHYQYDNMATQAGQAMETITFVQGLLNTYPDAVVIMPGDYYTEPGSPGYEVLISYFNNSWNDFHGSSTAGYTYPSDIPTNRFDHIWYKKPADFQMTIDSVTIPNVEYSDHRPLVTQFRFPTFASNTVAGGAATTTTSAGTPSTGTTTSSGTTNSQPTTTGGSTAASTSPSTTTSGASSASPTASGTSSASPTASGASSASPTASGASSGAATDGTASNGAASGAASGVSSGAATDGTASNGAASGAATSTGTDTNTNAGVSTGANTNAGVKTASMSLLFIAAFALLSVL